MIDYEKLKMAHELAAKISQEIKWVGIKTEISFGENGFSLLLWIFVDGEYIPFHTSIDNLLAKLVELSGKTKPKYKIGQEVWTLNDEYKPEECIIEEIDLCSSELYLDDSGYWWTENQLYSSREELIEAEIEYWLGMLEIPDQIKYFANRDNEKCQHEQAAIPKVVYKCIKCGELYE